VPLKARTQTHLLVALLTRPRLGLFHERPTDLLAAGFGVHQSAELRKQMGQLQGVDPEDVPSPG